MTKNSTPADLGTISSPVTGRVSSRKPSVTNVPKKDTKVLVSAPKKSAKHIPAWAGMIIMDPDFELPPGFRMVGMHTGPRTKFSHPYSYDPLIVFESKKEPTGSAYSDRLRDWYSAEKLSAAKLKHFGKQSDYYAVEHAPSVVEAFLQDLMDKPNLELVCIEEHCNQATGFPVWFFAYAESQDAVAYTEQ